MRDFEVCNLQNSSSWNEYLEKLPVNHRDIYFTPEYCRIYEENGDGIAKCFIYKDGKHIALYPFLLNSVNELGYKLDKEYFDIQGAYGYNGVISNNNFKTFIQNFYNVFTRYCNENNIIAEFVRFHPLLNNQFFSNEYLNVFLDRNTVIIDLKKNDSEIFNSFSSTNRRSILKAIKNQIEIKVYQNEFPYFESFISMYHETMDRVNSISYLYFNKKYFENLFHKLNVIQFVAFLKEEPIASLICFYSDSYFHYHLGSSRSKFLVLRPNNLLFFEMIKFAKKNGQSFVHLGGGNTSSENDSLLRFKSNFSNAFGKFYIGKKIHNNKIYYETIKQWEKLFPEKIEKYNNLFLKYRF